MLRQPLNVLKLNTEPDFFSPTIFFFKIELNASGHAIFRGAVEDENLKINSMWP